ncbi:Calmin Calponin-like transmembrane domain protein [Triplophysa tibetana]|uniref:Calmin n=1 Tax=Triplophysa tibetana TaxID=1572043 RepID=A0A5A9NPS4_9TELE|nr:Calmin Calponin-like transmembrane domain protein [Triplophysa tibetana]
MAGHEWDDWFEREELIGQISDMRVQNLQVEREVVQKRTFTRWMNLHLEKCNPPLEVRDLFRDIQDGKLLMALLEELSGCKLLHGFKPSSHRIFRLNNIAKVLTFLEERNVKLVSIDAADVADGNPSIVLGLIWNIILFFQIKELTGNIKSQFPSSSSLSSIPTSSDSDTSHSSTPPDEKKPTVAPRGHGRAIKKLLQWVQRRTRKYGVAVQDFGKSWASGLAFLAVIKSIDPSLVDMRRALLRTPRENIEEAFRTAHYSLGIPRLLETEDVMQNRPDEQSIMTYVSQFLEHFPGIEEDETSDILERSKTDARSNNYPVRNGVQRKRESYTVKKDLVQPPPKIFVSSVSEDQEQITSPVLTKAPDDKPWSNESSSISSSPSAEEKPLYGPLDLNKETPQTSISDSAVKSPDSWSENTTQEETQPVRDDSINESSVTGEKFSTTDEGTSDLGSPFSPESTPEIHLFIDEGNYSLSSVDSFYGKPTQLTEEEDAYKYILDLKEEESADSLQRNETDAVSLERTRTDSLEYKESVKPSEEPSYIQSDSGYFQDHREAIPAQPEDAGESPLDSRIDVNIRDENTSENESFQDIVDSSNTEATERNPLELTDEKPLVFEDESECPVLKYERVSISGSEEDIKLSTDLAEEPDTNNLPNGLNGHDETKDDSVVHNGLSESEAKDVVMEDLQEPVAVSDQIQNEEEECDEDPVCCMCGGPVAKSSTEDGYNSDSRHELEAGESCKHILNQQKNKLNGTLSDFGSDSRETNSISNNLLSGGRRKSESGSDDMRETEVSHNANGESQAQVSENKKPGEAKNNRPVSVLPRDDVDHDVPLREGDEQSVAGQSPGGKSETEHVVGVRGYPERRPAELRLSLSMTPLQPATPQRSLTESDTDTEDASEGHGEGLKTRKPKAGSAHIQEQNPFDRHPGEWGAVEPESPAEHRELIKTDTDVISAGARENTVTLRDGADACQPLTTIHLRKTVETSESKGQIGRATDSAIINESSENKTAATPATTSDTAWSDIYILLVAWLLIYCIFVLPQMDPRTLPKLFFNTGE